jgi:hypothetical protein
VLFSLALHHFTADDAVGLLRRCRDLSRANALVADLRRDRLVQTGVHLLTTFIFREAMTRNDARASIRRAFSFGEMAELARAAGWENFGHRRFAIGRQAIWLEK